MKKKILFVINSLGSGGAEKSLVSLLMLFDYSQYDVDLLMFSKEGLYLPLIPKEVTIIKPPMFIQRQDKGIKYLFKYKYFKDLYLRIKNSLDIRNPYLKNKYHVAQILWRNTSKGIDNIENEYDVAIAYSQGMPTYYVVENVKAKKKLSWVNTDYKRAGYNSEFDEKYFKKLDKVVTVSQACKKVLDTEVPSIKEKTTVICDIVSSKLIKTMAEEKDSFNDNFNGTTILTVGRLVEVKGYDLAIEACKKLRDDGIVFKWYVLGEGNLKSKIEKDIIKNKLEEYFILLGVDKNPYKYMKKCDIYVQSSKFEGKPIAINEAKILCKPIVTTGFDTLANQIINEVNGLVAEIDATSLYINIKRMIIDKDLKNKFTNNLKNEKVDTESEINKIYELI